MTSTGLMEEPTTSASSGLNTRWFSRLNRTTSAWLGDSSRASVLAHFTPANPPPMIMMRLEGMHSRRSAHGSQRARLARRLNEFSEVQFYEISDPLDRHVGGRVLGDNGRVQGIMALPHEHRR